MPSLASGCFVARLCESLGDGLFELAKDVCMGLDCIDGPNERTAWLGGLTSHTFTLSVALGSSSMLDIRLDGASPHFPWLKGECGDVNGVRSRGLESADPELGDVSSSL